jgi:pimeloyl-ACP methyl ester carboxylesterase
VRRRTRWLLGIALGVVAVALAVPAAVLGPYALRVRHLPADPGAGHHAGFYLYVPPAAKRAARRGEALTLLVQPNNSGINSDDPEVHRKDAWWTGFGRHGLADKLRVALLVPAFVRPNADWRIYTHALDRDVLTTTTRPDLARLDLQLLAMVDRARAALAADGLPSDERFLVQGYSASGMFANRLAALHPERVKAVAAGAPGGWPIAPHAAWQGEALPYPAGVADLEALTGRPFDLDAWRAVPQLLVLGALDGNDSLDFRDGWDEEPAALVDRLFGSDAQARWRPAEALYRAAGADARFLLVDGVGHDRRALQEHTTRFFAAVLAGERQAQKQPR